MWESENQDESPLMTTDNFHGIDRLVGSTALSARMDSEDLREIIPAYQKCVTETVRRFGSVKRFCHKAQQTLCGEL